MMRSRPLHPSARGRRAGRLLVRGTAVAIASTITAVGAAPAGGAEPRRSGTAKLVSVDGPARLTLKAKAGKVRLRLFNVDTPQVGECGASESTTALRRLAKRRKGRLRYELLEGGNGRFERDAEGRYLALVAPPGEDGFFSGLGQDLVDTEWARHGDAVGLTDRAVDRDFQVGGVGFGSGSPRTPRGVWVSCGGRMHLPAGEPIPAHAPAPWTITADGVTEAVGPLSLSPTLSPSTNLTIAQVAAVVPVELVAANAYECRGAVPSLQIVLSAATPTKEPCGTAAVYAVATSGPGAAMTTRGVGVGSPAAAAKAAFPRLAGIGDDPGGDESGSGPLRLTGSDALPWAWQTLVDVDRGKVDGFLTSAGPLQED